jgi:hypothetical protein
MPFVPGPRTPFRPHRSARYLGLALALVLGLTVVAVAGDDTPAPASQAVTSTRTLAATADAVTRADAPTKGGTARSLRVDGAPVVRSFLRFSLGTAGPVRRATLRLLVETPNRTGFSVRKTSGSWTEASLTHAKAPAVGAAVGASGAITAGQTLAVDVTSAAKAGGTLNLAMTTSSSTNTRFTSREGGANGPRLELVAGTEEGTGGGTEPPPAGGTADWQPTAPIRAGFYYPWFPEAWRQQGKDPFAVDRPSAGYYDSSSPEVVAGHIEAMRYGGMQAGISSWWGRGTRSDLRFPQLLAAAAGKPFRWAVYQEGEGQGDPSVGELTADLTYLRDHYGKDPSYLRIDGRFVAFVYGDDSETCDMVDRWRQANTVGAYVVLKVFGGFRDCPTQPDGWHQYGPAVPSSSHLPYSVSVSPGFFKATEPAPRLARDLTRWERDVETTAASTAQFHLITTFNEWGEGTAVESSTSWPSSSGYGQYLDVLHRIPSAATLSTTAVAPADPVIAAVGDMACDPGDANFKGGAGGRTSCHQLATSNLVVNRDLAAFLPLGDNQYEDGTLAMAMLDGERCRVIVTVAPGGAPALATMMRWPGAIVVLELVVVGAVGASCVWAGMINSANPVGTVSAESSFRMRVFLLVNRDRGPPGGGPVPAATCSGSRAPARYSQTFRSTSSKTSNYPTIVDVVGCLVDGRPSASEELEVELAFLVEGARPPRGRTLETSFGREGREPPAGWCFDHDPRPVRLHGGLWAQQHPIPEVVIGEPDGRVGTGEPVVNGGRPAGRYLDGLGEGEAAQVGLGLGADGATVQARPGESVAAGHIEGLDLLVDAGAEALVERAHDVAGEPGWRHGIAEGQGRLGLGRAVGGQPDAPVERPARERVELVAGRVDADRHQVVPGLRGGGASAQPEAHDGLLTAGIGRIDLQVATSGGGAEAA